MADAHPESILAKIRNPHFSFYTCLDHVIFILPTFYSTKLPSNPLLSTYRQPSRRKGIRTTQEVVRQGPPEPPELGQQQQLREQEQRLQEIRSKERYPV